MSDSGCDRTVSSVAEEELARAGSSRILVMQQNGSGESKIQGIRRYGTGLFELEIVSIDIPLPSIVDDTGEYLPEDIHASLVLDFLRHPDLSQDLARMCVERNVPVVASGKKMRIKGVFTPPT